MAANARSAQATPPKPDQPGGRDRRNKQVRWMGQRRPARLLSQGWSGRSTWPRAPPWQATSRERRSTGTSRLHGSRSGNANQQVQASDQRRVLTPATVAASGSNVTSRNRRAKSHCTSRITIARLSAPLHRQPRRREYCRTAMTACGCCRQSSTTRSARLPMRRRHTPNP